MLNGSETLFEISTNTPTHLSDLEQEGDPKGAKHFLVEMSNRDEHFTVLVQVHLVQRNLLREQRKLWNIDRFSNVSSPVSIL